MPRCLNQGTLINSGTMLSSLATAAPCPTPAPSPAPSQQRQLRQQRRGERHVHQCGPAVGQRHDRRRRGQRRRAVARQLDRHDDGERQPAQTAAAPTRSRSKARARAISSMSRRTPGTAPSGGTVSVVGASACRRRARPTPSSMPPAALPAPSPRPTSLYPFLLSNLSYDANNVYLTLQVGGFAAAATDADAAGGRPRARCQCHHRDGRFRHGAGRHGRQHAVTGTRRRRR